LKQTFDSNGMTLPSQLRGQAEAGAGLRAIRLRPPPHLGLHQHEAHLQVQVHQTRTPHFDSEVFIVDLTREEIILDLLQPLVVAALGEHSFLGRGREAIGSETGLI
jgi:hypothetical protein